MVHGSLVRTGVPKARWTARLQGDVVRVCPTCDAYALGIEHETSVPFYSFELEAFATVHDWDWWNAPPDACDTRSWPDFGCVTFSEGALRGAVELAGPLAERVLPGESARRVLGHAAGFPEDTSHEAIWREQLQRLEQRVGTRFERASLEQAVRALLLVLHRGVARPV